MKWLSKEEIDAHGYAKGRQIVVVAWRNDDGEMETEITAYPDEFVGRDYRFCVIDLPEGRYSVLATHGDMYAVFDSATRLCLDTNIPTREMAIEIMMIRERELGDGRNSDDLCRVIPIRPMVAEDPCRIDATSGG